METRPAGIGDEQLRSEVCEGWGFDAATIEYTPLGFGSHHWTLADPDGTRRFATVDELEGLAPSSTIAFEELAAAFETARVLSDGGYEFVVAPLRDADGTTLRRLTDGFSIALFPYVDGRTGEFGDVMHDADRRALVEHLAALHDAPARVRSRALRRDVEPVARSVRAIESALAATRQRWTGGPFSEPARDWLIQREPDVRRLLVRATGLLEEISRSRDDLVVTHGEPHPGNVIGTDQGLALIDWDTVGLAHPERDLWFFAADEALLTHYSQITGRAVDRRAIAFYSAAWTLADLSVGLADVRGVHEADEDRTHTWHVLQQMHLSLDPT
jgi:spectinomycin phosphotransferase